MKFQKFVKSIGSEGVVYVRKNEERWLASGKVLMKIPDNIRSITADDVLEMPEGIDKIINYESFTDPCALYEAIMPEADGTIEDCVRIFATENCLATLPICNSDYTLIERGDIVEMYVKIENVSQIGKALVIKRGTVTGDTETIGIIFPTDYKHEEDE